MCYDRIKFGKALIPMPASSNVCSHFQDESKTIDLPCSIGDTIWCIESFEDIDYIVEATVTGFGIFASATFISYYSKNGKIESMINFTHFNKTAFLTEEAAQRALEEMKND